ALAMPNPHVQDEGGFFSADAVAKANEKIAQIKRDYGKDLYVETWPYISDSRKGDYQPEEKDAIFKRWADEIGQKNKVDGIVVLICRTPSYLQVTAGKKTIQQAFISQNVISLKNLMLDKMKAKLYDD